MRWDNVEYRVADAHAHIYPRKIAEKASASIGAFYRLKVENIGLAENLLDLSSVAGIERWLVCSVATKADQVRPISEFIASSCGEHPGFVGLGAWHQDLRDIGEEMDIIESLGLRGIKLHPDFQHFPIDMPAMLDVYREAARRKCVILFHMGDDRTDFSAPHRLAAVLDKVPDLVCIAAHMGGYRVWQEAQRELKGGDVYIDTSSSLFYIEKEDVKSAIRHFGTDRVLFGTDFPMWTPKTELERFLALGLPEEENRRILYDNFAALFGEN
jgi:predicted TIM-barrel fold metal-dependent hydrolase